MNGLASTPLRRCILGSALAALAGWFIGNTAMIVWCLAFTRSLESPPGLQQTGFLILLSLAGFSGGGVLATWLLILLPLYLFVPRDWLLWRWPICTLCGALVGWLNMFGLSGFSLRDVPLLYLASAIGAATGLVASLTAKHFDGPAIETPSVKNSLKPVVES